MLSTGLDYSSYQRNFRMSYTEKDYNSLHIRVGAVLYYEMHGLVTIQDRFVKTSMPN